MCVCVCGNRLGHMTYKILQFRDAVTEVADVDPYLAQLGNGEALIMH